MTHRLLRGLIFCLFTLSLPAVPCVIPLDFAAAQSADGQTEPSPQPGQGEPEDDAQPADDEAEAASQPAGGQSVATEEWDITADRIIRYEQPLSIVAEGNIVLVKRRLVPPKPEKQITGLVAGEEVTEWDVLLEEEDVEVEEITPADLPEDADPVFKTQATVKADWATYDITLNTIKARGNVSVVSEGQKIEADQATINLEQETGTFRKATIVADEKEMYLQGEVIEKIGYKTYHIEDGWVVTCRIEEGSTAPWSFAASDAVIEQDGYATLKHARFRIRDVPVLYSPWLVVPAKNKRESGFLLPEFGTGENSGFSFNLPFFWAISDSTDLTIYTQYFANRGYMPGLEFRYITSATDQGLFFGNYLYDDLSDPSETEYYEDTGFTHDNKDRYWFRGKANQNFGSWTSRLDLDIVSDRDYLTEFNSGFTGFTASNERFLDVFGRSLENRTDDQRTNTFGIQRAWGATSLTGRLLAINDVRFEPETDDDTIRPTPLWNLPSIDYTGTLPFENFGDLTLQWDTDYVNFWREEGIGGQRFDIYPTISAPVPISQYLESRAELGLRDTFYVVQEYGDAEWDDSDTQNRLLFDFGMEVGSTLLRTFALSGKTATGLTHEVRPYVEYDYIPDVDQDDLPSFDGVDRVFQQNRMTYGIDNFFDLLSKNDTSRDYGTFKIKQSYSFLSDDSDEPFSDINAILRWYPTRALEFEYNTDIDVYENGFVKHDLDAIYRNSRGDRFILEYFFQENGDFQETEQVNARLKAALFGGFSTRLAVEHSIANDETNEAEVFLLYQALCWSVELGSRYTPAETTFLLMFNLANLGSPLRLQY